MQGHSFTRPLILSAGFPCQNASTANNTDPSGVDGIKTGLIWETIRIMDELEPEYLFLENVAGLVDRGRGWGRIVHELTERGHCIWWQIISAAAFGFPFEGKRLLAVSFSPSLGLGPQEVSMFDRIFEQTHRMLKPTRALMEGFQREDYTEFLLMDNGLSPRLASKQIHAIGNSIQPIFSEIIFKTIKAFHETIIAA